MRKTVIFEFPDDFEFPKVGDGYYWAGKCQACPCAAENERAFYCLLTDDVDAPCPFYGNSEAIPVVKRK